MASFGKETAKALENFGPGTTPPQIIRAMAEVKLATFRALKTTNPIFHPKTGRVSPSQVARIENRLMEMAEDPGTCVVPFSLMQGGAGTSLHMAIVEAVLPDADTKEILDILGLSQSTNDVVPTAFTIALYRETVIIEELVIELQEKLVELELEHTGTLITGRTQMQDALPMTFGQVFGGWAGAIARDRWRIHKVLERLRTIALGGTALGTGSSAAPDYVFLAEKNLREITALPLSRSQNWVDEISNSDKYSEVAGVLQRINENLSKISSDLILYTSSRFQELSHPDVQKASTIMPFKKNPVILEFCKGLALDSLGESMKVSLFAQSSNLQINPWLPFLMNALMKMSENTQKAISALLDGFLENMVVKTQNCRKNLFESKAILNSLRSKIDYSTLDRIHERIEGKNYSEAQWITLISKESGYSESQIKNWLSPENLIRG